MDCVCVSASVHLGDRIHYLSQGLVLCQTCERGIAYLCDLVRYLTALCNSAADLLKQVCVCVSVSAVAARSPGRWVFLVYVLCVTA